VLNFIRSCADDLKTLYFEGHLAMKPAAGGDEIARWFWGETAAGQLLRRLRDRLDASDDPRWKAAAFGVARRPPLLRPLDLRDLSAFAHLQSYDARRPPGPHRSAPRIAA
jgi:hypothetical protein